MSPYYFKNIIYLACCCLGDEYLDEIDLYQKDERERLYPKQPFIQQNNLRKSQSLCLSKPSPKIITTYKNKKQRKQRIGLKWIIGDEYLN